MRRPTLREPSSFSRSMREQYIGEALCWDKAYFPYRTDKYEGVDELSRLGRIELPRPGIACAPFVKRHLNMKGVFSA